MTTYVIKYQGQPDTYNLGSGWTATIDEATRYDDWHAAKEQCAELCEVEGVFEYEAELARIRGNGALPQTLITREQLIGAIQDATDVVSIYDDAGQITRTITYVDPTFLIKALQELS